MGNNETELMTGLGNGLGMNRHSHNFWLRWIVTISFSIIPFILMILVYLVYLLIAFITLPFINLFCYCGFSRLS